MSRMDVDFLIIGQGLAGSALAIELLGRGKRVLVVDRMDQRSSSRVAAGLITPLKINDGWIRTIDTDREFGWQIDA